MLHHGKNIRSNIQILSYLCAHVCHFLGHYAYINAFRDFFFIRKSVYFHTDAIVIFPNRTGTNLKYWSNYVSSIIIWVLYVHNMLV